MSVSDQRRAARPEDTGCPVAHHDPEGYRRVGSFAAARTVLRARSSTRQAGFTAEHIPEWLFSKRPILIGDGPHHDEQRRRVARFFAPAVVDTRYSALIEQEVERSLTIATDQGEMLVDRHALHVAVAITASIVGLTHAPVTALASRLERFFRQPPLDRTRADLGRTRRDWMQAAVNGLGPLAGFYRRDVAPAVRARRRAPREDVISHLLQQGYQRADLLAECLTYGTAGMVTTREFMTMAAWHVLDDAGLRRRYAQAGPEERERILAEIIRLEPPVGHLYRRMTSDLALDDDAGCPAGTLRDGDLVDLNVRQINTDADVVGGSSLQLDPERSLTPGVPATGLSFGDGAHRCPGQHLALRETDAFVHRLAVGSWTIVEQPRLSWDQLIEGYRLRGLRLRPS